MLKLGLDLHYRQVTVALQEDGGRIKVAGKMSYEAFDGWISNKLKQGWSICSCYEAGASGYWLHRELQGLGIQNLVVAPQAMDEQLRSKRPISVIAPNWLIVWIVICGGRTRRLVQWQCQAWKGNRSGR